MKNPDDEIMQRRRTTPVERLSLKTATEHTVHACGGGASAVWSTRIGETQICRCADKRDADYLTIDVVGDLEKAAGGKPFITEALARITGHTLVPINGPSATAKGGPDLLARLIKELNDVTSQYAQHTADGEDTYAEAASRLSEIEEAEAALRDLKQVTLARLARPQFGEAAE